MRNLKKLLAVIMTVALIASMMVPALAAGTYESEAAKLKEIGLFVGTTKTDGSTDFLLGSELYRDQAMILIIRALGEEKAALALTDAEVAETLANVVDADKIASWAKKYAAYALKEKLTYGVGGVEAGKIKFGPDATIDGTDFTILLLRALGYSTVSKTTVLDVVVEAGVLSQIDAIAALSAKPYYRDFAAHTIFGAVKNGETADGESFIETLIAAGAVDAAKAAAAGFIAPAPTTLEVVGASATNLKEVVVTFNTALDEDSAETISYYDVEDEDVVSATLNADGKAVTLLIQDTLTNQGEFDVTVSEGVKSAAGIALADEVTKTISVFDVTIPSVISAEQTGPDTFEVTFSEPVQTPTSENFSVDGGTLFIQSITTGDNFYTATIQLYSTLSTGTHTVKVTGVKDFAGYANVITTLNFTAEKDEVAPVVSNIISASPEKVVIEFSEKIYHVTSKATTASKTYHTNSSNTAINAEIDGKKLTLTFSSKLPNGTAYLTIAKEVIKDAWGNKNAAITDLAVAVTVDVTKPTVSKVEAPTDKKLLVVYSEEVKTSIGKFTVLDSTGTEVSTSYSVDRTSATHTAITFASALSGSTYTVVVENVQDLAGNVIDKVSVPVAVTDTTAPTVTTAAGLYISSSTKVKISFSEVMNSSDLLNLGNYYFAGEYLSNTKATASIADAGKAVVIDFTKATTKPELDSEILVGKVRDLAGNYISGFSTKVIVSNADVITVTSIKATGTKTVVVKLSDALSDFKASDFALQANGVTLVTAGVSFTNTDGKGVITFTLVNALSTTATTTPDGFGVVVTTAAVTASVNSLGGKIKANITSGAAVDGIAPAIAKIEFTSNTSIKITFTEAVKSDTVGRYTFSVTGNTVTAATLSEGNTVLTLTLDDAVADNSEVTVTQNSSYPIEDASKGNSVSDLEADVTFKE